MQGKVEQLNAMWEELQRRAPKRPPKRPKEIIN
jgi:hypothetical protein